MPFAFIVTSIITVPPRIEKIMVFEEKKNEREEKQPISMGIHPPICVIKTNFNIRLAMSDISGDPGSQLPYQEFSVAKIA